MGFFFIKLIIQLFLLPFGLPRRKLSLSFLERYEKEWERDCLEVLLLLTKDKLAEKGSLEIAIRELLSEAALAGSEMDVLLRRLKKIPIITVHQSKGCEFDTVLLAGADNLMFPLSFSVEAGREDEERRLFYVAISRAKRKLVMSCYKNASINFPRGPSKYVYRIPQEYIKWHDYDGKTVLPKTN